MISVILIAPLIIIPISIVVYTNIQVKKFWDENYK